MTKTRRPLIHQKNTWTDKRPDWASPRHVTYYRDRLSIQRKKKRRVSTSDTPSNPARLPLDRPRHPWTKNAAPEHWTLSVKSAHPCETPVMQTPLFQKDNWPLPNEQRPRLPMSSRKEIWPLPNEQRPRLPMSSRPDVNEPNQLDPRKSDEPRVDVETLEQI